MFDRLIKLSMLAALVATFLIGQGHSALAQLGQGEATAVLDLETGEIIFDFGSNLQVFGVESNGPDIFDVSAFDPTNAPGSIFQVDPDAIGGLSITPFPAGVYSLGPVIDESARSPQDFADFTFRFGGVGFSTVTATLGNGVEFAGGPPPVPPVPTPPTPEPPTPEPPTPVPPTPVPPTPTPPNPVPSPELPTTPAPIGSLSQGEAQAFLNLETGEVVLDIGSGLQVLGLEAGGEAIFNPSGFSSSTGLGPAQQLDPDGIGFLSLSPFSPGTFNLGPIIDEAFLTPEGVANFTFRFLEAGTPELAATLGSGVFFTDPSIPLPEPPTPEPPAPEPPAPEPAPEPPAEPPLPPDPSSPFEARAFLDISTGEVILEVANGQLQIIGLSDANGADIFDISAFDATTGLGPAGQLGSNGIGFLGLTPFPAGTFNLGAIIDPSFRTEAGLAGFRLQFGQAGVPSVTASLDNGGVLLAATDIAPAPAIPEPGALTLFSVIGLGAVARRRRR